MSLLDLMNREADPLKVMNDNLDLFTNYISILKKRSNKDKLAELCELRGFSRETVDKHDIFWVGNMSEMLVPTFIKQLESFGVISETNKKPIFHDRWIIPIKNSEGKVINLVGYTNQSDERYIYGTGRYYDRQNTLFGLENINKAYEIGYAILTEGITDTLAVRDAGYENTFAACGTFKSDIKMNMLNRCRYGIIRIPDRDKSGDATRNHWKTNRYFTFNTPIMYKDASETINAEEGNKEWFIECMDMAIDWIKQREHQGIKCPCEESTML